MSKDVPVAKLFPPHRFPVEMYQGILVHSELHSCCMRELLDNCRCPLRVTVVVRVEFEVVFAINASDCHAPQRYGKHGE